LRATRLLGIALEIFIIGALLARAVYAFGWPSLETWWDLVSKAYQISTGTLLLFWPTVVLLQLGCLLSSIRRPAVRGLRRSVIYVFLWIGISICIPIP
jgi:hypothetical protein